jgi:hypothetical protein
MSPDDPVREAPLVEPPMRGWKLHPPNMDFGLPEYTFCMEEKQEVASVLTPHFEEMECSSLFFPREIED